jgi:hypothetical protein
MRIYFAFIWAVNFAAAGLIIYAYAQEQPQQPPRDKFFWCQQQRNFFADTAAVNAAEAAKLQEENEKLKAELAALKKAAPEVSKAQ